MNENDKNTCKIDISLNEFKDIIFKDEKKKDDDLSPFDYLITSSDYELTIENNNMLVSLNLKVLILKDEPVEVKLFDKNKIIVSANVNKGDIGFNGEYYSFLSKTNGEYNIKIKYLTEIRKLKGLNNIKLNPLSDSEIKVFIPENDNFIVSPYISLSETIQNKNKIVEFYVKKGSIKIIWGNITQKEPEKKIILPAVIHAATQTVVDISDTSVSYNSEVKCNIYQTPVSKLEFTVKNAKIITITGNNIKSYDIDEKSDESIALIDFEYETEGEYIFNVYYEKELGLNENLIKISSMSIKNAERDEGYIIVSSKTVSDLEFNGFNNIRIIDINELPQTLKQNENIKEALKYLVTPFGFDLKLIKHKKIEMPDSVIKNAIFNIVIFKKGIVLHSVFLEIKNSNKPFLQMELIKGVTPLSTFIKGKPVKAIKSENGNMMLSLPKFTSPNESFWIEIILISFNDKLQKNGKFDIILPEFDITISHLYWKLYLPDKFKYKKFKGNIEMLDYFKTEPPYYPYNYTYNSGLSEFAKEKYDETEEEEYLYDDFDDSSSVEMPAPAPMQTMNIAGAVAPVAPKAKVSRSRAVKMKKKAVAPKPVPRPVRKPSAPSGFIQKQVGKIPVKIDIPLIGEIKYYEKLFIEKENIKLSFNYKRTGKDEVKPL